jgi:hypothetical protein
MDPAGQVVTGQVQMLSQRHAVAQIDWYLTRKLIVLGTEVRERNGYQGSPYRTGVAYRRPSVAVYRAVRAVHRSIPHKFKIQNETPTQSVRSGTPVGTTGIPVGKGGILVNLPLFPLFFPSSPALEKMEILA